ncbi:dipeptidase [Reyranella sp.]|uniref:dipeptidase n=1 Tax=Reyranella sp. TaxID=1929291 RepID=UPI0037843BF3
MRLSWHDLGTPRADRAQGKEIEITGWPTTALAVRRADYFLLTAEPNCCTGCVPGNRLAVIEVFAGEEVDPGNGALRLSGTLHVVADDADGWRYQLRGARRRAGVTRRALMAASPLFCLPVPALAQAGEGTAVDIHSHAGNLTQMSYGRGQFAPVAEPMRQGGMAVVCLAVVADSPVIKLTDGRLRPSRDPRPGELYEFSQRSFPALHAIAREQGMPILRTAAELRAARSARPSIVVAAEGADFLEGRIERLAEAYQRWSLRHLQLTHYRPNELGDIQTEPGVHGGLTAFGAEVIRQCNRMGIVVDVAHGTYELVKRAAATTTKPLVLSHTSLTERPAAWTRRILPDHARAIAATGGVIGIWPVMAYFPNVVAFADGMARMAEIVGVDHVGLGTDQLGLPGGSSLPAYSDVPQLVAALRTRFNAAETDKILGGNYRRVFDASLG